MKNFIKQTLREQIEKNSLGVSVTRPDSELVIMRGIPGAGKSTEAERLKNKGKIHSTDNLISASGDYREFFAKMIANKDFTPLSRMHSKNLSDAIESMKRGVSPVIIDNTNIKHNEAKAYVVAALEMGYADNNIKFVDIGTAGLDAQKLADRNTHGVPLDKIKSMIDSHTAQGPMTLKSVLNSKDMYKTSKNNDISYSAVILTDESMKELLNIMANKIPQGWTPYCHHMTIKMGELKDKSQLGKKVTLTIIGIGHSEMAMAFEVAGYPSDNKKPHITIAVNPNGGKPVMSNYITDWQKLKPFNVEGVVSEIPNK